MAGQYHRNTYDPYRTNPSAGARAPSTVTVVVNQPSELAPLIPKRTGRTQMPSLRPVVILCLLLVLLTAAFQTWQTWVHLMYCPPDPAARAATRSAWDKELSLHAIQQRQWAREKVEQKQEQEKWRREVKERDRREEEKRERWQREIEERGLREEEQRKRWQREIEERDRREEEQRERWQREIEERNRWEEEERERWQREVEERDRREEEERQKRHMFWGHVEPHACTTYATREYTAQLMNLPRDWKHRLDACKATPLEIHGISYLPNTCEDRGTGVMIGRWEINEREPDCTTFWDSYSDKGCSSPGSGRKYITHKLMNLPEKADWSEFCATTPARFDNLQFPGAQECFKTIWGAYGQWEIEDRSC